MSVRWQFFLLAQSPWVGNSVFGVGVGWRGLCKRAVAGAELPPPRPTPPVLFIKAPEMTVRWGPGWMACQDGLGMWDGGSELNRHYWTWWPGWGWAMWTPPPGNAGDLYIAVYNPRNVLCCCTLELKYLTWFAPVKCTNVQKKRMKWNIIIWKKWGTYMEFMSRFLNGVDRIKWSCQTIF